MQGLEKFFWVGNFIEKAKGRGQKAPDLVSCPCTLYPLHPVPLAPCASSQWQQYYILKIELNLIQNGLSNLNDLLITVLIQTLQLHIENVV